MNKDKAVIIREIKMCKKNLRKEDVYVLDFGTTICQWKGKNSHFFEKRGANEYVINLRSLRAGKIDNNHIEDELDDGEIPTSIDAEFEQASQSVDDEDEEDEKEDEDFEPILIRISDKTGKLEEEIIAKGDEVSTDKLNHDDVFIFDNGKHCYVWIGSKASQKERSRGMIYAYEYLKTTNHFHNPVSCIKDGRETKQFFKDCSKK